MADSAPLPPISLIYARARNGVIGRDNGMPWHLPEDLAHFRRCTGGHPVVMGRRTWDSLPPRFRPLPGRTNVVVTRQADWQAPGALVVHDLRSAFQACAELQPPAREIWVTGGAQVYREALPCAQRVVVTEIARDVEGDTHMPALDTQTWAEATREAHVGADGTPFAFVTYLRRQPAGC